MIRNKVVSNFRIKTQTYSQNIKYSTNAQLDISSHQAIPVRFAGLTGLEPATSCVTGKYSNHLSYNPAKQTRGQNIESANTSHED